MATAKTVITAALRKLNAIRANQPPTDEQVEISLDALNTLIDSKSNALLNIHIIKPYRFQLVAGQLKYSLGPTGDWVVERPMRLEKAKLMTGAIIVAPDFVGEPSSGGAPLDVTFTPLLPEGAE